MKIKQIILGVTLCFAFNSSFANYTRVTKNGGANGYDKTSKTVVGENTDISCSDPGFEPCPTASFNPLEQPLINYALDQISVGNLKGSYSSGGLTVTWLSDSSRMLNSSISVQ